jgi:hypothetical protein
LWQFRACGWLYVDGRHGQLQCFVLGDERADHERWLLTSMSLGHTFQTRLIFGRSFAFASCRSEKNAITPTFLKTDLGKEKEYIPQKSPPVLPLSLGA